MVERYTSVCLIPPDGYICTREGGHTGPCAGWPRPRSVDESSPPKASDAGSNPAGGTVDRSDPRWLQAFLAALQGSAGKYAQHGLRSFRMTPAEAAAQIADEAMAIMETIPPPRLTQWPYPTGGGPG